LTSKQEQFYKQQIAELKAENAALKEQVADTNYCHQPNDAEGENGNHSDQHCNQPAYSDD